MIERMTMTINTNTPNFALRPDVIIEGIAMTRLPWTNTIL